MIKAALKKHLSKNIATRRTDPDYFYNTLQILPNPDIILRKLGATCDIYQEIMSDAHVIGEVRSMRAGIIGHQGQLLPGGDSPQDRQAFELCEKVFSRDPSDSTHWADLFWHIAESTLKGFSVQEVVWQRQGNYLLPEKIINYPQRRFVFSQENKLRLLTRDSPMDGTALSARKWILTRHMPSYDNPYGVAVLSSCFWPYTFKHSGFKYLVKFCEKYGTPWVIGKYPEGTPQKQQDELVDALARMVEDAVAAIPDSGSVQLIESASSSKQVVQERLINLCNREMSKALTSQTLATEIQGSGSFAAAKTHSSREQACYASDRKVIAEKINELLRWITEINLVNANPPTFCFHEELKPRKDWVEVLDTARHFLKIPEDFAYQQLQIPKPKAGAKILPLNFKSTLNPTQKTDFTRQKPAKHLEQWIEVFRVGKNKDSKGSSHQFSLQHLDEIISNFDTQDPPPYVIGHPKLTDPAYGWVKELKRQGNELWARGTDIEPAFDKLVKDGRYRKRSVRLDPTANGWKLIHIGFLGAVAPAIAGLKDNWHFGKRPGKTAYDFVF